MEWNYAKITKTIIITSISIPYIELNELDNFLKLSFISKCSHSIKFQLSSDDLEYKLSLADSAWTRFLFFYSFSVACVSSLLHFNHLCWVHWISWISVELRAFQNSMGFFFGRIDTHIYTQNRTKFTIMLPFWQNKFIKRTNKWLTMHSMINDKWCIIENWVILNWFHFIWFRY